MLCVDSNGSALRGNDASLGLPLLSPRPLLAGNSYLLAECQVRTSWGASILVLGQEMAHLEDSMTALQTASRHLNSIAGAALVAIGLFLLLANLDAAATPVTRDLGISREGPGMLPALGLAALHAVQAYTFNHAGFLSSLRQILISFWPVSLVLFGLVLLRNAVADRLSQHGAGVQFPSAGIRS